MKILFLPNWHVHHLAEDTDAIQSPDKYIEGKPYWFFKYFPQGAEVKIIDVKKKNIFYKLEKKIKFYIWQGVLAFIDREKYDVVVSHGAQSGLVYSLLCYLCPFSKNNPKHFIIDVGGFNGARINRIETPLVKWALKSHPYIICHSSILKDLYEHEYKNILFNTQFIRFGVNVEEFHPRNIPAENYVLSFGFGKRDYPILLEAWRNIKPNVRLVIIGNAKKVTDDRVEILPKVSIEDLKKYISKAIFVVIPLEWHNYSYGQMSFLQSMAMGKPVVVTNTPGSSDYLIDGIGAFLVKFGDVQDLYDKIQYLLDNSSLDELGADARRYIVSNLTEEIMGSQIADFIQKSIKESTF